MGKRGTFFFGLTFGVLAHSAAACAQGEASPRTAPPTSQLSETGGPFGLVDLARRDIRKGHGARARDYDMRDQASVDPPSDKIDLHLEETPLDGGPRFEIGAFGRRLGGGRRNLVHIGMDWAF